MSTMENESEISSSTYIDVKPLQELKSSLESSTSIFSRNAAQYSHGEKPLNGTKEGFDFPILPADWELNNFLHDLAQEITDDDVTGMKDLFRGEGGIGKRTLDNIKSASELFDILRTRGYLKKDDLLWLQAILRRVGRKDLVKKAIEYANTVGDVLHFYSGLDTPENGYRFVKMHVDGKDFKTCSRGHIESLRHFVSKLLFIPLEFVIIQGIEPSSSMLITFMIPQMYAELLEEMLKSGQDLTDLRNIGVDMVKINQCYNIQGNYDVEIVETEQQLQLMNVYQQLQRTQKQLEDTEERCIELSRKSTNDVAQLIAYKEKFFLAEGELISLRNIFSLDDSKNNPATLASKCSIVEFEDALNDATRKKLDKDVLRRLIDATTTVASTRIREGYSIHIKKMALALEDMSSKMTPIVLELKKYQFFFDMDLEDLEKSLLEMLQRLSQSIPIKVELSQQCLQILNSLSKSLRGNEKEKLKRMYSWNADDKIKQMMRNQSLFLAGIFYKEVEKTRQPVDFESFIDKCLQDVGRDDLRKKFVDMMKKTRSKPCADARKSNKEVGAFQTSIGQRDVINRMAEQIEAIYNMVESTKSSVCSKQDIWHSPIFPYFQRPPPYPGN